MRTAAKTAVPRDKVQDTKAAQEMMTRGVTGLDVVKALAKRGFPDVANNVFNVLKQRVSGDYLHTSAILDENFNVLAAVNDLNDYMGPGTGYRISPERWAEDLQHPAGTWAGRPVMECGRPTAVGADYGNNRSHGARGRDRNREADGRQRADPCPERRRSLLKRRASSC